MLASGSPAAVTNVAVMTLVPPLNGTDGGAATTATRETAAAPIAIRRAPSMVVTAAPALAVMTAVPDSAPAKNVADARPNVVGASIGSSAPSVVANLTMVPLGAARPMLSTSSAVIVALPLNGNWLAVVESAMDVEGDGAAGAETPHAVAQIASAATRAAACDPGTGARSSLCMRRSLAPHPNVTAEADPKPAGAGQGEVADRGADTDEPRQEVGDIGAATPRPRSRFVRRHDRFFHRHRAEGRRFLDDLDGRHAILVHPHQARTAEHRDVQ